MSEDTKNVVVAFLQNSWKILLAIVGAVLAWFLMTNKDSVLLKEKEKDVEKEQDDVTRHHGALEKTAEEAAKEVREANDRIKGAIADSQNAVARHEENTDRIKEEPSDVQDFVDRHS